MATEMATVTVMVTVQSFIVFVPSFDFFPFQSGQSVELADEVAPFDAPSPEEGSSDGNFFLLPTPDSASSNGSPSLRVPVS